MARFVAAPVLGHGSWDISEVDADGMGRRHLSVTYDRSASYGDGEQAARMLAMALSLPGGIDDAIKLIRAELARVS